MLTTVNIVPNQILLQTKKGKIINTKGNNNNKCVMNTHNNK